jgi:hypothetical protein
MDMGAARAPTIQGSEPCRRSRQSVWISRRRPGCYTPPIEATLRPGVLSEAAAVSGRHGSLRLVSLLVARAPGTRPYRTKVPSGRADLSHTGMCGVIRRCDGTSGLS